MAPLKQWQRCCRLLGRVTAFATIDVNVAAAKPRRGMVGAITALIGVATGIPVSVTSKQERCEIKATNQLGWCSSLPAAATNDVPVSSPILTQPTAAAQAHNPG